MSLTIIIPTLNPSLKLYEQIKKVLNSNLKNYEILIIHQGLRGLLKIQDKRVKYYRLVKKSLSYAKNYGILKSNKEIITIIDDDIILNIKYLNHGLRLMNFKKDLSLLFGNIINKNKKKFSINIPSRNTYINFSNFLGCLASAMWFRNKKNNRKVLFDENFGIGSKFGSGEETDIVLKTLLNKNKIYYYNKFALIHFDENNLNYSKYINKYFKYGIGNGALYKKYMYKFNLKIFVIFLITLLKSFVGLLYGLINILNVKIFLKYVSLTFGRIVGYIIYRNNG